MIRRTCDDNGGKTLSEGNERRRTKTNKERKKKTIKQKIHNADCGHLIQAVWGTSSLRVSGTENGGWKKTSLARSSWKPPRDETSQILLPFAPEGFFCETKHLAAAAFTFAAAQTAYSLFSFFAGPFSFVL